MKEKFSTYVKSIIDQDIELSNKITLIRDYGQKLLGEEYHNVLNQSSETE